MNFTTRNTTIEMNILNSKYPPLTLLKIIKTKIVGQVLLPTILIFLFSLNVSAQCPTVISGPSTVCPNGQIDLDVIGEWPTLPTNAAPIVGANPNNEHYSQFNSSGTFNSPVTFNNAEVLVVAGGGGGGGANCNAGAGSAGGAGGLIYTTLTVSSGTTITVGNGGATNANGGNSVLNTLTAIGGGRGGFADGGCVYGSPNGYGILGGSGGSAMSFYGIPTTYTGGAGTLSQGNAGASSPPYSTYAQYVTGGGGGAGGAGGNATSATIPGDGGIGLAYSITGISTYYAGGGGGTTFPNGIIGSPGLGVIGRGGTGGGAGNTGTVIIRYRAPKYEITGGTAIAGASIDALTGILNAGSSSGTIDVMYTSELGCVVTKTITVNPTPLGAITSTSSTICHGNSITLSGTVSSGGTLTIDNGVGTPTISGTNWTTVVNPSTTTTYAISTLTSNLGCSGTGTGSTTVTLPIKSGSLSTNGESATCAVSGTNWVHFYHPTTGNLIGSVNANGDNLGNITLQTGINSGGSMFACNTGNTPQYQTAYMGRNWQVSSTAYPASANFTFPAILRFPYAITELSAMNLIASGTTLGNPNDNGATLSDIMLTKISGGSQNGDPTDDCSASILGIEQDASGSISVSSSGIIIASGDYAEFKVSQFSEMFLHKKTISPGSALPVKLINFSATCENEVTLSWTTASEQNSDRFIVEKSRDGKSWSVVARQTAAGTSNTIINYTQTDENSWNDITYYRLKQIDYNGVEEVYGPISVSCGHSETNMSVYPNPSSGSFTIEIASTEMYINAQLILTDMTGKIIYSQSVNVANGTTKILMDRLNLKMGTYLVSLRGADQQLKPVKVMVTN